MARPAGALRDPRPTLARCKGAAAVRLIIHMQNDSGDPSLLPKERRGANYVRPRHPAILCIHLFSDRMPRCRKSISEMDLDVETTFLRGGADVSRPASKC